VFLIFNIYVFNFYNYFLDLSVYCHLYDTLRAVRNHVGGYTTPAMFPHVIPLFPPSCKYNYSLLRDYGQTDYVWMLELMNLLL
jgi:hypothetical protein